MQKNQKKFKCTVCKKIFTDAPSQYRINCSHKCGSIYKKKIQKGKKPYEMTKVIRKKISKSVKNLNQTLNKSPSWKGGKYTRNGYVYVYAPNHPYVHKNGYKFEHRLIMEKMIGRFLKQKEVVHHKNGIRNDNRIENLFLFKNSAEHAKHHYKLRGGLKK